MRLNKLLSIEIIYQDLYKTFLDGKNKFSDNWQFYYHHGSQRDFNQLFDLYESSSIDKYIITKLYKIFPDLINNWSEIWLKYYYPKMYNKLDKLKDLIYNPEYKLLISCILIDYQKDKFAPNDCIDKLYKYINTSYNGFENNISL